ncbi:MAG: hypothetical protein AAGF96_06150 [Bacteroidota bacterium]
MTQHQKTQNSTHQTPRPARQGAASKTEAAIIGIFGFFGIFSKYVYIYFQGMDPYPLFGYEYLSQFSWSIGNEVFSFSMGVVIFVGSRFMTNSSGIRNVYRALAILAMASGLYFMGWIFFQDYFYRRTEILLAIAFSFVATSIFILFLMYLTREIRHIRELKESVVDFFIEISNVHLFGLLKNSSKLEFLDEVEIEEEAMMELKKEIKSERKTISKRFQKRLKEKSHEIENY